MELRWAGVPDAAWYEAWVSAEGAPRATSVGKRQASEPAPGPVVILPGPGPLSPLGPPRPGPTPPATTPRYVLEASLQYDTTYSVCVEAYRADGARLSASPSVTVSTGPVPPVIGLVLERVDPVTVRLGWEPSAEPRGYRVARDGVVLAELPSRDAPQGGRIVASEHRDVLPPPPHVVSRARHEYRVEAVHSHPTAPDRFSAATAVHLGPEPVVGYADLHTHQFGNLAYGGSVVHGPADGSDIAEMGDCEPTHGDLGREDPLGNMMMSQATGAKFHFSLVPGQHPIPVPGMKYVPFHRTDGQPEFSGWPRWFSYTHQQMWVDWLRRAHEGGLRLMIMLAVNNEVLCGLTLRRAPGRGCSDAEAIELQLDAARRMEERIDAEAGGPGRGWYRIVREPEEARAAIAAGQLAVVLGVEVDDP